MRLFIVVEGQTEEELVKRVLVPHLANHQVWAVPIVVTTKRTPGTGAKYRGGGHWAHWRNDLMRLSKQHHQRDVRITTLFDLYGIPADFPGYALHANDADTVRRVANLEEAMFNNIGDKRLIPYIQRHEVEALIFADLQALADVTEPGPQRNGVEVLRADVAGLMPESINDGRETSPSKRLLRFIPRYRKTMHGPRVMEAVGLARIRRACPRFNNWVTVLEALGTAQEKGSE